MIGSHENAHTEDNSASGNDTAISKTVTEAGKTLTLHVRPMYGEDEIECLGEDRWEVSIEGKPGQCTTWSHWYPTAEKAMQRGMAAILEEGVDEFYNIPEFSYK